MSDNNRHEQPKGHKPDPLAVLWPATTPYQRHKERRQRAEAERLRTEPEAERTRKEEVQS